MELKQGRRKPFEVEYVKVTDDNMSDVALWCGGVVGENDGAPFINILDSSAINKQQTRAFVGDYVVRHKELNTYKKFSVKNFARTYEQIVDSSVNKSSVDGRFVSNEQAAADPDHVVHQQVQYARSHENAPDGVDPKSLGADLPRDAGL